MKLDHQFFNRPCLEVAKDLVGKVLVRKTEDGEIINVDGNGNRVAALTFGPKSVVIACGINKIVRSVQDAETRARTIAAPINAQRFDITTPCIATGRCCDCKSPQSICCVISRIRLCKPKGRIKVVIIGESLGF